MVVNKESFECRVVDHNPELKDKVFTSSECRIRRKDGGYFWPEIIFCNASKEDKPGGNDCLFLIRDIHDRKIKDLADDAAQRWFRRSY